MKKLSRLNLRVCQQVTDGGVAHLADLKRLTHLDLLYTQATDASVKHLAKLEKLERLVLPKGVSSSVRKELRKALPKCRID
jgi:hypothetical protein